MSSADNIEDIYELSPMQQGMLFHTLYSPNSGAYIEQSVFGVEGQLDVSAFERAWQRLVERHTILRSSFLWEELEKPIQVVHRHVEFRLDRHDWRHLSEAEQQTKLESLISVDQARGFELSRAPLMRLTLIRITESAYKLLWSRHHLLLDRWSRSLILTELFKLYDAFTNGNDSQLADPIPFGRYIAWLLEQDKSGAEAFWRNWLKGHTGPTSLEVDRKSDAQMTQSEDYAAQRMQLSAATTTRLKSIAREQKLTLNTLAQGAWALLLSRYSGEAQVVFGATVSGRAASVIGIESMVGLLVNTLPVRVKVLPHVPVSTWLIGLQDQQSELHQFEHSSLMDIHRWSEVEPGQPLFESIFVFENIPVVKPSQSVNTGLQILSEGGDGSRTGYPLTVMVNPGLELTAQIVYDCRRFDATTINRMLGHLKTLLEEFALNPGRPLSELSLVTKSERQELLSEWNVTAADYPIDSCITLLFEEQVRRTPNAIAVVYERQELTYADLNERANQLAHYLRKRGVGPEVFVGICLPRSPEMIIGLLGILKAGGAYVPLDPAYPQERLRLMMEDAGVGLLLSETRLAARPAATNAEVLYVDEKRDEIALESTANIESGSQPENVAYVIYTSGSTGRPKGVQGLHRSTINRFAWMWRTYPFESGDICCQKTSLSFVDSVWEIFGPLLRGIQTVILSDDVVKDPYHFVQALADREVTRIVMVPSLLRVIVETFDDLQHKLPRLKHWVTSGEALPVDLYQQFAIALPESILINLYGSSEVAADVTWYQGRTNQADSSIPIGRPIANTQTYILDPAMQPLPIGLPGELCIGGDNLARGYFNQPEMTAERFVPNPFGSTPGARLYKTGDLAKYRSDGNIEYLGRLDYQVKIRGHRIELGEVETTLRLHSSVRDVAVVATGESSDTRRLVAYIVSSDVRTQSCESGNVGELRAFLKRGLPEHMLPSTFIFMPELPLSANGKIDRKALPVPGNERPDIEERFVDARTPVEEVLAQIWSAVLKLERVGVEDNFFRLGGHSLLATQVVSRVRDAFKVELPLRDMFEHSTVASLAARIEAMRRPGGVQQAPPLERSPREGGLPLSFAQQRLWFLEELEPETSFYNIYWGLRIEGVLNIEALRQCFDEIVRRHESLRTFISVIDGRPLQVVANNGAFAISVIDLTELEDQQQESEVIRIATEEAECKFDLSAGPLFKAVLLRLGGDRHVLLITMHHIVCDGWSLSLLAQELSMLYSAFCAGDPSPLAELPIQYSDFARWQRDWLQGDELQSQLSYWEGQLSGAPALLELPRDRLRPPKESHIGAKLLKVIPKSLADELKRISQQEGTTLFMTLLAAFQTLLYRYSGQTDIVVGSPIANRTRVETERLIGFFANTLVLRTDLSGEPAFVELLRRVREVALEAYAHQDLPFERLVEELQPRRDLSYNPLFQVIFALQNAPAQAMEFAGLKVTPWRVDSQKSKVDLEVYLTERPEGTTCAFVYNPDLFDETMIGRMATHFGHLLESIVADPQQRISALRLQTDLELHQILNDWNRTSYTADPQVCIQHIFEQQVERSPHSIALSCNGERLTYDQLNRKANRLAHYLLELAVKPDSVVAICIEHGLDKIIALLAILKAGAAYLPIDPSCPKERLSFMLADARAAALITDRETVEILAKDCVHLIGLDGSWKRWDKYSEQNPGATNDIDNLAYVIYTSGSTGKPKGVQVAHRNLSHLFQATRPVFQFQQGDVCTLFHSVSFDFSVWEIWTCLLNGGTLEIVPQAISQSPAAFFDLLRLSGVTVLSQTPSALSQLIQYTGEVGHSLTDLSLRLIVCGGEALPRSLASALLNLQIPLCNFYGPTEATVWAAFKQVQEQDLDCAFTPLGHPMSHSRIYLLDSHMQPVVIGASGELHIGGEGVARGYWNRPALTAERFIPDPFSSKPGARLYKTGDLARYLSDGNIEFLGRIDHQVKMRGYRIELTEIEAVLCELEDVRDCVVAVRDEDEEDKRIVAYVVGQHHPVPSADELRESLKKKLPEYMLPSTFVFLEELPLTPNGKIDRKRLPAPGQDRPELCDSSEAPRTPVEEVLSGIWATVLKLERVGNGDNFFKLGGHSLLATQVVSRVRAAFKVELPLRAMFEHSTVSSLAAVIDQSLAKTQVQQLSSLLAELEQLSDEDAQRLLGSQTARMM